MNINSYVWKDARLTFNKNEKQVETRLVDMEEEQLQMVYEHCKEMLYNTNPKNAGRMIILDQIAKQINYCRTELALRWFKSLTDSKGNYLYTNESLMVDLRSWTSNLENPEEKNIIFTGNTGVGKTFLTNCIAKEVLKLGIPTSDGSIPFLVTTVLLEKKLLIPSSFPISQLPLT